jgi:hypothetical protein
MGVNLMKDLVDIFKDNKVAEDGWWNEPDDCEEDELAGLSLFNEEDLLLAEEEL